MSIATLQTNAIAEEKITLKVASYPSFDQAVLSAEEEFEKLNPNIDVQLVSLAFSDHHTAITTALASGANLPDVVGVEVSFIGRFAVSGGLEDLSKAPYNGLDYQDKFSKFTYPQASSDDGRLAAIPADIGPGTLFYRKDLLDKAGIELNDMLKSWDSFITAGKQLKEKTGAHLLASAVDLKDIYIRVGLNDGEGIYFDKDNNILVNSERFKRAFELAKAARDAGIDAEVGAWSPEWSEGLKRGQIATQMMGSWLAGHLRDWIAADSAGLWRASHLPEKSFASWGGSFYSIPTAAKNKEAAWKFIQYMTLNKSMQLKAFKDLDAFPALLEAQNDDFLNDPIPYLGDQKARQLWKTATDNISAVSVNKFDPIAAQIINNQLEAVLENGKAIDQALSDAAKKIKRRARL